MLKKVLDETLSQYGEEYDVDLFTEGVRMNFARHRRKNGIC